MAYYLLRNDFSWKFLTDNEKKIILEENRKYNMSRDDYALPERYGYGRRKGGENWDSFRFHEDDDRAQALCHLIERERPKSVLEIGPGAGFYTRLICNSQSVENYTAVDVGRAFLAYLQPRLEEVKGKKRFTYHLICGEITDLILHGTYDLIVLLSTVHHIPNRIDLFLTINSLLSENGAIFCFDPSHYIIRILRILYKCLFQGYLSKDFIREKSNLSTHHMCSLGEYKRIIKKIPGLMIANVSYTIPKKAKTLAWALRPRRLFSTEIGVVLKKQYQ